MVFNPLERGKPSQTQRRPLIGGVRSHPLTAGKTNRQFWGCPAYPKCKGTQEIET
jgi:ssDNA-binding Zn-finger/Zn-ribbon topoisomerase 1